MAGVVNERLGAVMQPGEVHLLAAVMYHTAPGAYASMAVTWGHTVVIMDHFDAQEALRLIEQERVTWTQMAPIHLVRIVGLPEDFFIWRSLFKPLTLNGVELNMAR